MFGKSRYYKLCVMVKGCVYQGNCSQTISKVIVHRAIGGHIGKWGRAHLCGRSPHNGGLIDKFGEIPTRLYHYYEDSNPVSPWFVSQMECLKGAREPEPGPVPAAPGSVSSPVKWEYWIVSFLWELNFLNSVEGYGDWALPILCWKTRHYQAVI